MSQLEEIIGALLRQTLEQADCSRRSVAAMLVKKGRVVGIGWNSLPEGSCLAGDCPRGQMSYAEQPAFTGYTSSGCVAIHAEDAAITAAGSRARGATCYVTCEPCPGCAELLAGAGVEITVVMPLQSIPALVPATH